MNLKPDLDIASYAGAYKAIDSHTAGEFTRIVVGGVPDLPGRTMIEKKEYFMAHYDTIRTALMFEPRGHRDMFGAILTEPCNPQADFGIFFIETAGVLNMCGHGSIGAATALVEAKLVPVQEPFTEIAFDAPAGLIKTKVRVEQGHAVEVSIVNVPSFLYKKGLTTNIAGKEITYDLAFGGSFFTMVDASQFGLDINEGTVTTFIDWGMKILRQVNAEQHIKHPLLDITGTDVCEFYSSHCKDGADVRNVVAFGKYQADRSPCGTGTSAKMASLFALGKMEVGQSIINESFIGTRFKGTILGETTVGPFTAIIPQITGSAYITGVATYLIDADDPLKDGFLIG